MHYPLKLLLGVTFWSVLNRHILEQFNLGLQTLYIHIVNIHQVLDSSTIPCIYQHLLLSLCLLLYVPRLFNDNRILFSFTSILILGKFSLPVKVVSTHSHAVVYYAISPMSGS